MNRQKDTQLCYKQSYSIFAAAGLFFDHLYSSFPGTRTFLLLWF